jgi:O-antigen ligase
VNHAHSDVVEIVLETGVPGLLLILGFLLWWSRRAFSIWMLDERPDPFARAAVIASAAVIAHSFVDYPLRTAAISSVFAVCLALMAQPRSISKKARRSEEGEPIRHLQA